MCVCGRLCSYMMCNGKEDLHRQANWPGVEGGARERLMDKLQGEPLFLLCVHDFISFVLHYQFKN